MRHHAVGSGHLLRRRQVLRRFGAKMFGIGSASDVERGVVDVGRGSVKPECLYVPVVGRHCLQNWRAWIWRI